MSGFHLRCLGTGARTTGTDVAATATPATTATERPLDPASVANVATVAVATPAASRDSRCAACKHFAARQDQTPDGWCGRYAVGTWGAVPFRCEGYSPADPAALVLEARRQKVETQLRTDPKLRLAADVADAPLRPEPGRPVSIVLAVRTQAGIVSGEFRAPRDRFDIGVFVAYLKNLPEIPS